MNIASILVPQRTKAQLKAGSKKRALESVAEIIHEDLPEISSEDLFAGLIARERLGTTALDYGIAIPHCRFAECRQMTGSLFQFQQGVDFDAYDNQLVNIVFVLLVPLDEVDEHLDVLAMLAGRFAVKEFREALQAAESDQELYRIAVQEFEPKAQSA
jgi:PTS system nitrogen regulatory IIA component|tara:strand:+ start:4336 stop:4809 length:474 start_codon:yes stop_codon:yes gene_type:complete